MKWVALVLTLWAVLIAAATQEATQPELPRPVVLVEFDVHASSGVVGHWDRLPRYLFKGLRKEEVVLSALPIVVPEMFKVQAGINVVCEGEEETKCLIAAAYEVWFLDRNRKGHLIAQEVIVEKATDTKKAWIKAANMAQTTLPQQIGGHINYGWLEYLGWRERSDEAWRFKFLWWTDTLGSEA